MTMCWSNQLISRFIGKIMHSAGFTHLLTYDENRYVALTPSASVASASEGETQLIWSIVIDNHLVGTGHDKVMPGCLCFWTGCNVALPPVPMLALHIAITSPPASATQLHMPLCIQPNGELGAAIRDARKAAVVCNGPHYLPVNGTFAYAAAGNMICFIYLDLNGNVRLLPVLPVLLYLVVTLATDAKQHRVFYEHSFVFCFLGLYIYFSSFVV